MILSSIALFATLLPLLAAENVPACLSPVVRPEWRELSEQQRDDYVRALVTLRNVPSKIKDIGSPSRFDDVVYTHVRALETGHNSAEFLPWHRAFLHAFSIIMRDDANYTGPIPYWDWSIDSQAPEKSSVWSDAHFGGDGNRETGCVTTGAFANYSSTFATGGCLKRDMGITNPESRSTAYSPESISAIVATSDSYDTIRTQVEWGPHSNIHIMVKGDMYSVEMSTNDPIFILHHTSIDRIWWMWQEANPAIAHTYNGLKYGGVEALLNDTLNLTGLLDVSWTVQQMMDMSSGDPLCYTYSQSVNGGMYYSSLPSPSASPSASPPVTSNLTSTSTTAPANATSTTVAATNTTSTETASVVYDPIVDSTPSANKDAAISSPDGIIAEKPGPISSAGKGPAVVTNTAAVQPAAAPAQTAVVSQYKPPVTSDATLMSSLHWVGAAVFLPVLIGRLML